MGHQDGSLLQTTERRKAPKAGEWGLLVWRDARLIVRKQQQLAGCLQWGGETVTVGPLGRGGRGEAVGQMEVEVEVKRGGGEGWRQAAALPGLLAPGCRGRQPASEVGREPSRGHWCCFAQRCCENSQKKGCDTSSLIPVKNLLQSHIYGEHPCFFCSKRSVQAKKFSFQTALSPFPSHALVSWS